MTGRLRPLFQSLETKFSESSRSSLWNGCGERFPPFPSRDIHSHELSPLSPFFCDSLVFGGRQPVSLRMKTYAVPFPSLSSRAPPSFRFNFSCRLTCTFNTCSLSISCQSCFSLPLSSLGPSPSVSSSSIVLFLGVSVAGLIQPFESRGAELLLFVYSPSFLSFFFPLLGFIVNAFPPPRRELGRNSWMTLFLVNQFLEVSHSDPPRELIQTINSFSVRVSDGPLYCLHGNMCT